MLRGWLSADVAPQHVHVVTLDDAPDIAVQHGILCDAQIPSADEFAADIICFAVKPQIMKDVAVQYRKYIASLPRPTTIISVAAGVSICSIKSWTGTQNGHHIIRAMPNLPAQIGLGITALATDSALPGDVKHSVGRLFDAIGTHIWVEEEQMAIVTAISGSGPAYIFYLIESMIEAGCTLGLSEKDSRTLTLRTIEGSTKLAQQSSQDASTLRHNVTSKGGTTEAALNILMDEQTGMKQLLHRSINSAHARALELDSIN